MVGHYSYVSDQRPFRVICELQAAAKRQSTRAGHQSCLKDVTSGLGATISPRVPIGARVTLAEILASAGLF